MDSSVFSFESNDEVSSLESWVGSLFVRCCGEECLMQFFIEMILLLSSCDDGDMESWDSGSVWR